MEPGDTAPSTVALTGLAKLLHTGDRVDAVLGSSVFERLFKLPPIYFQHRPTGVISARLQGVETIREVIASAAVTVALDLPFLLIFVAVMFYYSVTLTLIVLAILTIVVGLSLAVAPLFQASLQQQFQLGARNQAFVTEYVADSRVGCHDRSPAKKITQMGSAYKSELQRELADIRARIQQAQPNLDKTIYREGLMELRAPQDGTVKDLATTTVGAVVQPGSTLFTLVPKGEQLFADVSMKNEDVGFVQVGQSAQIKLATYPFQKYGMLAGKVIHVSADATESNRANAASNASGNTASNTASTIGIATYRVRVQLDAQFLKGPLHEPLSLTPGMQAVVEINQGHRSVLEYLLSPVQKVISEAGRER